MLNQIAGTAHHPIQIGDVVEFDQTIDWIIWDDWISWDNKIHHAHFQRTITFVSCIQYMPERQKSMK